MKDNPKDLTEPTGAVAAVGGDSTGGDGSAELEIEVEAPAGPAERVAELEAKQKDTHDLLLRALADNENFKRRMKKELDDARTDSAGRILREMLPVVDNLERALAHAEKQGADVGGIVEGVRLVLRQFAQAFERCGVTVIDAKGKPFDPNLHEAVSQQESSEQAPGTVLDVLQTGYKIGERLLRPTLAVVSMAPTAAGPSAASDGDGGDEPGSIVPGGAES